MDRKNPNPYIVLLEASKKVPWHGDKSKRQVSVLNSPKTKKRKLEERYT